MFTKTQLSEKSLFSENTAALAEKKVEVADSTHVSKKVYDTLIMRFEAEAGADGYTDLYHRLAF